MLQTLTFFFFISFQLTSSPPLICNTLTHTISLSHSQITISLFHSQISISPSANYPTSHRQSNSCHHPKLCQCHHSPPISVCSVWVHYDLGPLGSLGGLGSFFFFLRIKFGFVISVLRFVFVFVILKVKIKKSEIFVFVFGFLVATLF